jgi:DNA repair photolyase
MRVRVCARRPIVQPCSLEGHAFQIDPYVGCEHRCSYCYALNQAETDWGREVLSYQDIAGQVSDELAGLEPQSINMGCNSGPYQPCE